MAKKAKKKKKAAAKPAAIPQIKDFLDMTAPSVVKFNTDHAIIGCAYHTFMALRGYPASTEELVFGCKGLTEAAASVRNALLFNVLSYLSHRLLTEGNTVASIDELYLFLSNPTAIEYIRGFMKRVRKKDSAVMLASQNLEDFNLPGIAELTRPLFSIPTHHFLFNCGSIDARFFRDNLQLDRWEYDLVDNAVAHECLYKCGNERFLLVVEAPEYKAAKFGTAGGK